MADTAAPTKALGYAIEPVVSGSGLPSWNVLGEGLDVAEYVDELVWPRSIQIYQRMRNDPQIDGLLRGMTWPIRRYSWALDPRDCPPETAQMLADDVGLPLVDAPLSANATRASARFNYDEHLRTALLAMVYGHVFFEQVGYIDDAGWWRLQALSPRMPQTVDEIRVAQDGSLTGIRQIAQPVVIPGSRLVSYIWDKEGANWAGRPLLRGAYSAWLLKDRMLRVDAVRHERNGMGVPIIELPEGASEQQRQLGAALASQYRAGEASGGALPFGMKLSLVGTTGSVSDVLSSIKYQDEVIARLMLMMFTQLGSTETGSRALGQSFMDFFSLAQTAVAEWFATVFQNDVISDWIEWNIGPDQPTPALAWSPAPERWLAPPDLVSLIGSGAVVVDEELRGWIAQRYNMPDPPEEAVVPPVGGPRFPTQTPDTQPAAKPTLTETTSTTSTAGRAPARLRPSYARRNGVTPVRARRSGGALRQRAPATLRAGDAASPWPYRRQPFPHEVAAAVNYPGLDADYQRTLDDLIAKYTRDVRPEQKATLQAAAASGDLQRVLTALDGAPGGKALISDALTQAAESGRTHALAEAAAQGKAIAPPKLDPVVLARRAAHVDNLLSRGLASSAFGKAQLAAPDGLGTPEVASVVGEHVDSLTTSWLSDQLGGAITAAQNEGRMAVFDEGGTPKEIYASELMDDNTCDECEAIDGTQYDNMDDASSDYPTGGYVDCAGGPRCRGTIVVVW